MSGGSCVKETLDVLDLDRFRLNQPLARGAGLPAGPGRRLRRPEAPVPGHGGRFRPAPDQVLHDHGQQEGHEKAREQHPDVRTVHGARLPQRPDHSCADPIAARRSDAAIIDLFGPQA
ncbi:hypothetical protein Swit_4747 [Rhizorhabdus wittichii RW1]|uniref:Uncharacterized protein n=1 Tax=Rhizorhabdus wittichii (strain DSM 6014 / CCUG 31198 / JCM 15750 / NBRC 105917 / EY 4224 / RW1) TaxID=392499 RepID=A0A9J9HG84_RHIWR|nr:hypothetical protein Swit_4747 [Rhizorhabdus wittichii RW1]